MLTVQYNHRQCVCVIDNDNPLKKIQFSIENTTSLYFQRKYTLTHEKEGSVSNLGSRKQKWLPPSLHDGLLSSLLPDTDLTPLVPSFGNFQKNVKMHMNEIPTLYIKITGMTSPITVQSLTTPQGVLPFRIYCILLAHVNSNYYWVKGYLRQ